MLSVNRQPKQVMLLIRSKKGPGAGVWNTRHKDTAGWGISRWIWTKDAKWKRKTPEQLMAILIIGIYVQFRVYICRPHYDLIYGESSLFIKVSLQFARHT